MREHWADVAKAVAVALVVLGHVNYLVVPLMRAPGMAQTQHALSVFNDLAQPLRMPVFFAISGYFAAAAVRRPWRAVLRARVATNLYLFGLWLLIWVLVAALVAAVAGAGVVDASVGFVDPPEPAGLLELAAVGGVGPWFLFALALYFVVTKATWRLPRWFVIGVAAVLALCSYAQVVTVPRETSQVLEYLVWFVAAASRPDLLRRLASRPRPWAATLCVGAFVGLSGVFHLLEPGVLLEAAIALPFRLLAVVTGVLLAVLLARSSRLSTPWLALGRRTLPVYVVHPPLLFALHLPLVELDRHLLQSLPPAVSHGLAAVYAVALTGLLVALALGVRLAAVRAHAGWLFSLPGGLRPVQDTRGAPTSGSTVDGGSSRGAAG